MRERAEGTTLVRVTMEDVANAAGVSRALVSIAYRGAPGVGAATRERILAAGVELGYRHNRVAASLASKHPGPLGILLIDLHNDVFADMFDGIRSVTDEHGSHIVLAVGAHDGSRDAEAMETLLQSRVGAIISVGLMLPDAEVARFAAAAPLISVARSIEGVDSIVSDNALGARVATEHLLGLGHREIVFLANPPTDGFLGRREGYTAAMRAAGLQPRVVQSTYSRELAAADIAAELDGSGRPTAVLAHNDQAALGVLDAMAMQGLRAPHDISVVGYDNSLVSRSPGTALTTVDIHGRDLGEQAARTALARLADPAGPRMLHRSVPTLIVRGSSGPPAR